MRNMAVLHSPAFSYPLPVLVRVLFNLLIFKGKILYYNKYSERKDGKQQIDSKIFSNKPDIPPKNNIGGICIMEQSLPVDIRPE